MAKTSYRQDPDSGDKKKMSGLTIFLIVLAVIALLVLLAFAVGWIDFAGTDGELDVELPETNVDVDGPDLDVDVDGELEGDADAEVPAS